jgi:hypothetical protein
MAAVLGYDFTNVSDVKDAGTERRTQARMHGQRDGNGREATADGKGMIERQGQWAINSSFYAMILPCTGMNDEQENGPLVCCPKSPKGLG